MENNQGNTSVVNKGILKAAFKLVVEMDKVADIALPEKIVNIVKLHTKIGVSLAIVPVPGGDMVAAIANIWTMYLRINTVLGIKFSENILKTVASGIATNLAAYAMTAGIISTVFKFVPGIGTVGGAAIMGGVLYAATLASGYVYLKALTLAIAMSGGDLSKNNDIETNLKKAVDDILSDNEMIKSFIEAAKDSYKDEKHKLFTQKTT